jgi:hypothetical protein
MEPDRILDNISGRIGFGQPSSPPLFFQFIKYSILQNKHLLLKALGTPALLSKDHRFYFKLRNGEIGIAGGELRRQQCWIEQSVTGGQPRSPLAIHISPLRGLKQKLCGI